MASTILLLILSPHSGSHEFISSRREKNCINNDIDSKEGRRDFTVRKKQKGIFDPLFNISSSYSDVTIFIENGRLSKRDLLPRRVQVTSPQEPFYNSSTFPYRERQQILDRRLVAQLVQYLSFNLGQDLLKTPGTMQI
jgi:hypothetical protein